MEDVLRKTRRLLLAIVPMNSRALVRMLDVNDKMLGRNGELALDTDPALREHATGTLFVGARTAR